MATLTQPLQFAHALLRSPDRPRRSLHLGDTPANDFAHAGGSGAQVWNDVVRVGDDARYLSQRLACLGHPDVPIQLLVAGPTFVLARASDLPAWLRGSPFVLVLTL